eukprot:m.126092 g.126092  ORF g.126092 m.126092 type:complete len:377 (+) comp16330_c0_seq2:1118-2248(+)
MFADHNAGAPAATASLDYGMFADPQPQASAPATASQDYGVFANKTGAASVKAHAAPSAATLAAVAAAAAAATAVKPVVPADYGVFDNQVAPPPDTGIYDVFPIHRQASPPKPVAATTTPAAAVAGPAGGSYGLSVQNDRESAGTLYSIHTGDREEAQEESAYDVLPSRQQPIRVVPEDTDSDALQDFPGNSPASQSPATTLTPRAAPAAAAVEPVTTGIKGLTMLPPAPSQSGTMASGAGSSGTLPPPPSSASTATMSSAAPTPAARQTAYSTAYPPTWNHQQGLAESSPPPAAAPAPAPHAGCTRRCPHAVATPPPPGPCSSPEVARARGDWANDDAAVPALQPRPVLYPPPPRLPRCCSSALAHPPLHIPGAAG